MATGSLKETLYGRNPARECLRAGRRACGQLVLAEGIKHSAIIQEITALAQEHNCPIETKSREDLSRLAGTDEHQGVVLRVSDYPYATLEQICQAARDAGPQALVLLLDRLQDPQNVGTLLRTAEAVGVQGVILPKRRATSITPSVLKASAGACEHLQIALVTNLVPTIAQLQEAGLWIWGLEKHPEATFYTQIDWNSPLGIVVGSEGYGLRRLVRERCDGLVQLPMKGQIGSLNAAVAGSIFLYEILRSRAQKVN
jgi:23S rRNA (guanosine2251-2'-O)-methyltransferase